MASKRETLYKREAGAMSEAAKAARNAYKRRWAKTHPDNVRASNCRYWEKKAAQEAQAAKEGGA